MLFESNVFNMIDWFIDGVEPCTGMYIRTIPIARAPSCNMQGPILDLKLYFNQFSNIDHGFGVGWELSLSRIDAGSDGLRWLILDNGSRYKIEDETGAEVVLQYKKNPSFKLVKDKSTADTYNLIKKDGTIVTISNGLTTRIMAANGQYVNITWSTRNTFSVSDSGSALLINSIWDSAKAVLSITTQQQLLKLEVEMIPPPPSSSLPALAALQKISDITNPEAPRDLYGIKYARHNDTFLEISSIASHVNVSHDTSVVYTELLAPAGMPGRVRAVASRFTTLSPQKDLNNKTLLVSYDRSGNNYLGYPAVKTWAPGVDNLESLPAFRFVVKEKTGATRLRWLQYNKFYLHEIDAPLEPGQTFGTPRNGKSTRYTYALVADKGIDAQSPTFAMPSSVRYVRHGIDAKGKMVTVADVDSYTYDRDGNLIKFIGHDGVTRTYEYYPASGESIVNEQGDPVVLCPADPNGFINYLKQDTSIPSAPDVLPSRHNVYLYKTILNLPLILPTQKSFYEITTKVPAPGKPLSQEKYTYNEYANMLPGTLAKTVFSKTSRTTDAAGKVIYVTRDTTTTNYYTLFSDALGHELLEIRTVVTSFSKSTEKTTSSTYAVKTGACVFSVDENGLKTTYLYDTMGRVIQKQYPWGWLPNELATDTTFYDASKGTITTSSTTMRYSTIRTIDSLGNLLAIDYTVVDSVAGKPVTVSYRMEENSYNDILQKIKTVQYDYSRDKKVVLKEVTEYAWNLCDDLLSRINVDKSREINIHDYYNNVHRLQYLPANFELRSTYDGKGLLTRQEKYSHLKENDTAPPDQTDLFTYDGFCRLASKTSNLGEDTFYTYDAYDRVVIKKGSVSGVQEMEYAAHSAADLAVKVTVRADKPGAPDKVMATRYFDGVDRVILVREGESEAIYDYKDSRIFTSPSSISYTGGRIFKYEYNAALRSLVSRKVMKSYADTVPVGTRNFTFKAETGLLASAIGNQGACTQFFDYDDFGNVINERTELKNLTAGLRVICDHTLDCTLRGKPLAILSMIHFAEADSTQPLVARKFYAYEEDGGIRQIDIFVADRLRSRSVFKRNADGRLTQIDGYSQIPDEKYWLLTQRITYGVYGNPASIKYTYNDYTAIFTIFDLKMSYDKSGKLSAANTDLGSTKWRDRYFYDRSGFLVKWETGGNLVFENEYINHITGQSFMQDASGALARTVTMAKSGKNKSLYFYDKNRLVRQDNDGLNYPKRIDFQYDAEGHVISEKATSDGVILKDRSYFYEGEDNYSRVQVYKKGIASETYNYGFDAHGKIVVTRYPVRTASAPVEYAINIRYYSEGEIFCDIYFMEKMMDQRFCRFYHRVNGEVKYMTSFPYPPQEDQVVTSVCINQSNGSQIAVGEYICEDAVSTSCHPALTAYRFQINGQNPYGFTLKIADKVTPSRGNIYIIGANNFMVRLFDKPPVTQTKPPRSLT